MAIARVRRCSTSCVLIILASAFCNVQAATAAPDETIAFDRATAMWLVTFPLACVDKLHDPPKGSGYVYETAATLLAAIGLYGVMAYAVASRSREIGIRMALGADASAVVRLMLARGLKLVVMGGVLGLAAAAGLAQLMSSFLFGVSPLDPIAYTATIGLLGAVALIATYVPARRASRIDPLRALRTE
jgi:ABC-type antimicrobial peptide transport system permease subunit